MTVTVHLNFRNGRQVAITGVRDATVGELLDMWASWTQGGVAKTTGRRIFSIVTSYRPHGHPGGERLHHVDVAGLDFIDTTPEVRP